MTRVEERSANDREPRKLTAGPLRVLAGRYIPDPRTDVPAPHRTVDDELCTLALVVGVMG